MIVPSSNLFHLAYGKYANCCLQRQQHGADLGLVQRLYRVSSSLYHLAVERPTEILDDSLTTVSGALTCSERRRHLSQQVRGEGFSLTLPKLSCAIVTCGGLYPGINNVIRGLTMQAYSRHGVQKIDGIRCGYEGLIKDYGHPVSERTPDAVRNIRIFGGSILGTSRGPQDAVKFEVILIPKNIQMPPNP
ncbi:MAG TPA: 6-phosphofructokinase [Anaerolineales bacterium]|jgi:Phosphofructokinase|nr:6-phosphofructokinase [Anaerolineales bacterium]